MILSFSQDDFTVVDAAYSQKNSKIYGAAYCWLKKHSYSNILGKTENLFITAHGNQYEIGNQGAGVSLNPAQLASILKEIVPVQYSGSIYVSACDSAPQYVHGLLQAMGNDYNNRIYGCVGEVNMKIEPPGNGMWILAL